MSDISAPRRQLSLYLPPHAARGIEAVRSVVDPIQHGLIPAHITVCRDEEVGDPVSVTARLSRLPLESLTLWFGRAEPLGGHGWLLPCIRGEEHFHTLRGRILASDRIRSPRPHITLAHPRNPRAPGNSADAVRALPSTYRVTCRQLMLIEQEGRGPWRILETYAMRG